MSRKHAVRVVKFERDVEIILNSFYENGWFKDAHFYENGNHIMVFSIDVKEVSNTVSEEEASIKAKLDEMAFADVFISE